MFLELVHQLRLLAVELGPNLNPEVALPSMGGLVKQPDSSDLISILKGAPSHGVDKLVPNWLQGFECRLEVNLDFTTGFVDFILPCGDHSALEQSQTIDPCLILLQLYATQDRNV